LIASWRLTALIVGTLASAGAVAADRALTGARRPARFAWMAAMLLTSAWPVVAWLRLRTGASTTLTPVVSGVQRLAAIVVSASQHAVSIPFDRLLLAAWALASLVLLSRMIIALRTLKTRGRAWRADSVDGVAVRLSQDMGPAVIGIGVMEVVLPEWALTLDQPLRTLVLRHEDEHRRARDPYLLFAAAVLHVLTPWNLALWWQARRLRLAIEVDCDARVLRADPRPERYSLLLLAIAQRRAATHSLLAPALLEPLSTLEHRINAMRRPLKAPSRVRLAMLASAAVAAIVVACSLDAPGSPADSPKAAADAASSSIKATATIRPSTEPGVVAGELRPSRNNDTAVAFTSVTPDGRAMTNLKVRHGGAEPFVEPGTIDRGAMRPKIGGPTVYDESQVTKSVLQIPGTGAPVYPANLKSGGTEGEVVARFVVDSLGQVVGSTIEILRASHPDFAAAVRAALPLERFTPAEINGRKVSQIAELPFMFTIR
jgi:beta-lactamase regulating signal transducer with metallopeptidase domain